MRFWKLLTRRMAVKVFLALGLGIGAALLLQARADSRAEADTLKEETRKWADNIAHLFIGAVEHSMLKGDGIQVKESLEELKARVPSVDVRLYDQRGIEVFGAKPPPPTPGQMPASVAALLAGPEVELDDGRRVYRAIPNEERCHQCHDDNAPLRGVIELSIDRAKHLEHREEVMARIITAGFIQIMSARRSELLEDYFDEITRSASGITSVAVFDADADLRYGAEIEALGEEALQALLQPGARPSYQDRGSDTLALVPLAVEERCIGCHKDEKLGDIRGVLALSLRRGTLTGKDTDQELELVIDSSLRLIMLSELGRRIADFLDAVAETAAVDKLVLYDREGRVYWTTEHPAPPPPVAKVLGTSRPVYLRDNGGTDERLVAIAPLRNEPGCMQCHGSDSTLRGAVAVSVSTAAATMASTRSMRRRTYYTGLNLLGILFILGGLLQYFVARPVKRISDVADEIGQGNLGVTVAGAKPDGDEISRLAQHINDMVRGLRAKMHLEKFVSKGTAEAAASAGLRPIARTGERRTATVLFSDIRGFTAYSERVEPEIVVDMLNRVLRAQTEVVVTFGGDIDKYVGDELMAVFAGDDGARRAVQCAVRMLQAVHAVRRQGERLEVGIGLSHGEVIYGAIGHEERMDFTVVGDVVNTGARLCSAAGEDEILISEAVREAAGEIEAIRFDPEEPLTLKGKRDPLPVFSVKGSSPRQ